MAVAVCAGTLAVSMPAVGTPDARLKIELPDDWQPLPEVAQRVRRSMALATQVQAFGDPARGCYAAEILARVDGAGASWQAIDAGLGDGLAQAGARIASRSEGAARSEREVTLGDLRGRVRARYARTLDEHDDPGIDVAITACVYSPRAPAHCRAECETMFPLLEQR